MAIFIDLLYPDNKERQNRLHELTSDCQTLFADASTIKEDVEIKLSTCNTVIRDAYNGLGLTPPVVH